MSKKIKQVFLRNKPHCNVGTIGHVDHGKTTLTAAITRCLQGIGVTVFKAYSDIDNHVEERVRGITINAAHIEYETEKRHYSHIDCPGHQQYIKNMLTGAVQMEGAILVVSVNDGVQVQTREHVILAKEVGIRHIVVYINKLDSMVEPVMRDLVELEVRELLESYGFPNDLPVVKGSARLALNEDYNEPSDLGLLSIKKLMDTVDNYIPQPIRKLNAPFLLSIEQVYVITGRGTVITGKVEQGTLRVNDNLEIIGNNPKREILSTVCIGLEMFKKSMEAAEVGDNVGILIKGVKKDQLRRGFILAKPSYIKPHKRFFAKIYVLTSDEGGRKHAFMSNFKPQFFFRTASVTGTIILDSDTSLVLPGDSCDIKIELIEY
jgi:elongation factor Tu